MDILFIYIPDYSYKTQFIWRIPAVICTPAEELSVPFRRMWWQFCPVECDDSSIPSNVMTVPLRRMWRPCCSVGTFRGEKNQMKVPVWNILDSGPFHPGNVNLLSNFYKDCSLQFVTSFCGQFSPMPPLVLFIISMVRWGFLLTKKIMINQPFSGPCTPSTANPILVRWLEKRLKRLSL